jgi:hypothetical protein
MLPRGAQASVVCMKVWSTRRDYPGAEEQQGEQPGEQNEREDGARGWILVRMDPGSDCGSWQSSPTGKNEVLQRVRRGTGPTLPTSLWSRTFGNFELRCQFGRRNSRRQASSSHASAKSRSRDKLLVFTVLEGTITQAIPARTGYSSSYGSRVSLWSSSPGPSVLPYEYVRLYPCPGPFWSV